MYEEEQRNAKMQAEKLAYGLAGQVGDLQTACRVSLRERISSQRRNAAREGNKEIRLAELEHLLDKNPEVARILDLIEEVRG